MKDNLEQSIQKTLQRIAKSDIALTHFMNHVSPRTLTRIIRKALTHGMCDDEGVYFKIKVNDIRFTWDDGYMGKRNEKKNEHEGTG